MVILKFLMAITIQWSPPETMPLGVLMGVSYLAVDSNGVLFCAVDTSCRTNAYLLKYDGDTWSLYNITNETGEGNGCWQGIEVDSMNRLHGLWTDLFCWKHCIFCDDSVVKIDTIPGSIGRGGGYADITVFRNKVFVCFNDLNWNMFLSVFDGDSWHTIEAPYQNVANPQIGCDTAGRLHIVWTDKIAEVLKYTVYDGEWHDHVSLSPGHPDTGRVWGPAVEMKVDRLGRVHVIWHERLPRRITEYWYGCYADDRFYKKFLIREKTSGGEVGNIRIDKFNNPIIVQDQAFVSPDEIDSLWLFYYDGVTWSRELVKAEDTAANCMVLAVPRMVLYDSVIHITVGECGVDYYYTRYIKGIMISYGISEEREKSQHLNIYPTLMLDKLDAFLPYRLSKVEVAILNLCGQPILQRTFMEGLDSFSIVYSANGTFIPTGCYFLMLKTENGNTFCKKFILLKSGKYEIIK